MKRKAIVAALLLFVVGFTAFAEMGMYFKGVYGRGFRTREWSDTTATTDYSETYSGVTTSGSYTETLIDWGDTYSNFETMIIPSFGIRPWADSGNAFLRDLSFEFGLEMGYGTAEAAYTGQYYIEYADIGEVFLLNPSVTVVYGHQFGKVVPYVGVGVAVPIIFARRFNTNDYNYSYSESYDYGSGDVGNYDYTLKTSIAMVGVNANFMAGVGYAVSESFMPVFELGYGVGMGQGFSARIGAVFTIKGGGNGRSAPPPPPPPLPPEEELAE